EPPGTRAELPTEVGAEAAPPENTTAETLALARRCRIFARPLPGSPDRPTETGMGCAVAGNASVGTPAARAAAACRAGERWMARPSPDSWRWPRAAAEGRSEPEGLDGSS